MLPMQICTHPFILLTLCLLLCYFINVNVSLVLSGSSTIIKNNTIDITINNNTDKVSITMTGNAGVWNAFGFDTKIMNKAYAIIFDNQSIYEYTLGDQTEGIVFRSNSLLLESDTTTSSIRTVQISRSISESLYTFPSVATSLNIISAFGTDATYAGSLGHGIDDRASQSIILSVITSSPTNEPTLEPTIHPTTEPTIEPTNLPTKLPTKYCDLYDGTINPIIIQSNLQLTNIDITQNMQMSFNVKLNDSCIGHCNIIHIGGTTSVSIPLISVQNKSVITETPYIINKTTNGTISTTTSIAVLFIKFNGLKDNNDDISILTNFSVSINQLINIFIDYNSLNTKIYFNSKLYYTKLINIDDGLNSTIYPLYASSPYYNASSGEIDNICIASPTNSPTLTPTPKPIITTLNPTHDPTIEPTLNPTPSNYEKVRCFTETGDKDSETVSCPFTRNSFPTLISCGIKINNLADNNKDSVFIKGSYIDRNEICHIDFEYLDSNNSLQVFPMARCCDFKEAFSTSFECRVYESLSSTDNITIQKCPTQYPHLLSCSIALDNDESNDINSDTIDELNYGTYFYTDSRVSGTIDTSTTNITGDIYKIPERNGIYYDNTKESLYCVGINAQPDVYSMILYTTCCAENDTIGLDFPSLEPTPSPTQAVITQTSVGYYGVSVLCEKDPTRQGCGGEFNEQNDEIQITGIKFWTIANITDKDSDLTWQSLLIGEYIYRDGSTDFIGKNSKYLIESTTTAISDSRWVKDYECGNFILDTNDNNKLDFINGFEIYSNKFSIVGIIFYTYFGRKYSCPTDNNYFITNDNDNELYDKLGNQITVEKQLNITDAFGEFYGLIGFSGIYLTRSLGEDGAQYEGAINIIKFILRNLLTDSPTVNPTNVPTSIPTKKNTDPTPPPTKAPTTTKLTTLVPTASPLFDGQSSFEEYNLLCYTIWDFNQITCNNPSSDIMTGCSSYSVNEINQPYSYYIEDNNNTGIATCFVSSGEITKIGNFSAIATCCNFEEIPEDLYTWYIIISVICAVLFIILIILMFLCINYLSKRQYFDPLEEDDDTETDKRFEEIDVDDTIAAFTITEKAHSEMVKLHKQNSNSNGLEVD